MVGLLLMVFLLVAVSSMRGESPTFDEQFHLYSGFGYLALRNFSVGLAQPPLARMLAAIPLASEGEALPQDLWEVPTPLYSRDSIWWQYQAAQVFYYELSDPQRALFRSRLVMVLSAGVLVFLVYKWAFEFYGPGAGMVALIFCVFDPNLIAHARLVNTDAASALGMFASVYLMWRYSRGLSRKWLIASGIVAGAAILCKYSALVVLPILTLLVLGNVSAKRRAKDRTSTFHAVRRTVTDLVILGGAVLAVIWVCYLPALRSPVQPVAFEDFIQAVGMHPSAVSRAVYFVFEWFPLPLHFLEGLLYVLDQQRDPTPAFLMGQYSHRGWWQYFPVVFAVKTPLALIVAFALSVGFSLGRKAESAARGNAYLLAPPVLIFGLAMLSPVNIGIRHILPIYPFLFVFAARIVTVPFFQRTRGKIVTAGLCLWLVLSSLGVYPHYIPYFNEAVGGPDKGYKYLIDSNLDWGQDLDGLHDYMEKRGLQTIWLKYFGMALPEKHGVEYRPLPCSPVTGTVAISATCLQGQRGQSCYHWLKALHPVEKIGYSIFVYDVGD